MKTHDLIDKLNNRAESDELSKIAAERLADYIKTTGAMALTIDTLGKII